MKPKITIAKNAGFCFGVKRAYDLACESAKNNTNLYILGRLVHNDDVCADLYKRGIKEVKSLDDIKGGAVIFTAHGVGPKLYEEAHARGLRFVDTTCPKVMKVQRLAKVYAEKGYQVIIFGDKKHKEIKSIKEWANGRAIMIQSLGEFKKIKLNKNKKYCLVSQTTQNVNEFKRIIKYLARELKDNLIYFDTICPSTYERQKEVIELASKNDAVIVIGGKDSANSRRLFEISKKINPKTYFIENAKQLKKSWFDDIKKVAVSAGASTPEWAIKDVVTRIKDLYIRI